MSVGLPTLTYGKGLLKGHSTDYWTLGIDGQSASAPFAPPRHHHHHLLHALPRHDAGKMPCWCAYSIVCGMVLIVVTPLTAAQIMLLLDRFAGSHFFDTQAGRFGGPVDALFWIFGHPEVYVLVLPLSRSPPKSSRSFSARRSSATR